MQDKKVEYEQLFAYSYNLFTSGYQAEASGLLINKLHKIVENKEDCKILLSLACKENILPFKLLVTILSETEKFKKESFRKQFVIYLKFIGDNYYGQEMTKLIIGRYL